MDVYLCYMISCKFVLVMGLAVSGVHCATEDCYLCIFLLLTLQVMNTPSYNNSTQKYSCTLFINCRNTNNMNIFYFRFGTDLISIFVQCNLLHCSLSISLCQCDIHFYYDLFLNRTLLVGILKDFHYTTD